MAGKTSVSGLGSHWRRWRYPLGLAACLSILWAQVPDRSVQAAGAAGKSAGSGVEATQIGLRQAVMGNTAFRRVLMTGRHVQVVTMHLAAGQTIGMETHPDNDQMVLVVDGQIQTTIDGKQRPLQPHQMVLIPAGAAHDVKADKGKPAKIVVFYAPPLHPANEVQQTKPKDGH